MEHSKPAVMKGKRLMDAEYAITCQKAGRDFRTG
jgi:hypothetical protein